MKKSLEGILYLFLAVGLIGFLSACAKPVEEEQEHTPPLRISVLFNNEPFKEGLETSWGFSCFIEGLEKNILFDTGGEGKILLDNMKAMNVAPGRADLVVLSHYHGDHTNGLERIQQENPRAMVYMPQSFPESFHEQVKKTGAGIVDVDKALRIFGGVYTTGEMGDRIIEQSLILDRPEGLVVITGCAHPGIVDIVKKARELIPEKEILFVMGGFHIVQTTEEDVRRIIAEFDAMGVRKVAATHCTGDQAVAIFREAYGERFVNAGCGAVIEL